MRALPPGRIAFDLDDTLLRCDVDFPLEPAARPWLGWLSGTPPLRLGTRRLFATLQRAGWRPWVNCHRHEHRVEGVHRKLVKYPPAFGIDVLVDDSIAVAQQGEAHGFRVIRVDPRSETWVDEVLRPLGLQP